MSKLGKDIHDKRLLQHIYLQTCTIASKIIITPKGVRLRKTCVMKFDRSNKFDFCYYGQVKTFGGITYFATDGTLLDARLCCAMKNCSQMKN